MTYNLPQIAFVGGESRTLRFKLYTANGFTFNAAGCKTNFSVINYSNKQGQPVISKACSTTQDEEGIYSIIVAEITKLETKNLFGKFIYQLSIVDIDGKVEIPGQGILLITKNINQSFLN